MTFAAAVTVAAGALVWNNQMGPALATTPRSRAVANAAVAVATTATAHAVGVRNLGLNAGGKRWGAAAAAVPLAAYAVVGAIPALRTRVAGQPAEDGPAEWVLFRIPFGTVLTEELLFRSVLHSLSRTAFGPRWSLAFDAVTFGLWHWRVSRGSLLAMSFTGASALVFDGLRRGSGGVVAPAMFHYAVNGGGALVRLGNHGTE